MLFSSTIYDTHVKTDQNQLKLAVWSTISAVRAQYHYLSLSLLPFQGGGSGVVFVSCFGVRFSVMFHLMFVHYTFSSVSVAEWPPFGK